MMSTCRLLPFLLVLACGCTPPTLPARPISPSTSAPANGVEHGSALFVARDGTQLFRQWWIPQGTPARATLMIVHGLKDHSSRYDGFARQLAAAGYAVHAMDLRGHGRSGGPRVTVDSFSTYLDDVDAFFAAARADSPGPTFLFGHSMGGAIVTYYTLARKPPLAGLLLSGPALRVPAPLVQLAGIHTTASTLPNAPLLDTPDEDFSRDPAVVRGIADDPLVYHKKGPVRTAAALLTAVSEIWRLSDRLTSPWICVHGTADRLTDPRGCVELRQRSSSSDATVLWFKGMYHDLLHEPEHAAVAKELQTWLDAHTH